MVEYGTRSAITGQTVDMVIIDEADDVTDAMIMGVNFAHMYSDRIVMAPSNYAKLRECALFNPVEKITNWKRRIEV